jgi:hypothetical protein
VQRKLQASKAARFGVCRLIPDTDCGEVSYYPEKTQQPNDDSNDDHDIENFLDGGLHRDIVVNQPEDYSNNYQDNDQLHEWHGVSPVCSIMWLGRPECRPVCQFFVASVPIFYNAVNVPNAFACRPGPNTLVCMLIVG